MFCRTPIQVCAHWGWALFQRSSSMVKLPCCPGKARMGTQSLSTKLKGRTSKKLQYYQSWGRRLPGTIVHTVYLHANAHPQLPETLSMKCLSCILEDSPFSRSTTSAMFERKHCWPQCFLWTHILACQVHVPSYRLDLPLQKAMYRACLYQGRRNRFSGHLTNIWPTNLCKNAV